MVYREVLRVLKNVGKYGASVVGQHLNLVLVMPVSHMSIGLNPGCSNLIQLPSDTLGKQ